MDDFQRLFGQLQLFLDVVEAGSLSAAARHRGVAVSSLSRGLDALEQALGAQLLIRSTRSLILTDAGRVLQGRAAQLLGGLAETRSELAQLQGEVAGTLRLSCLPSFGRTQLMPLLADLSRRHPQLHIDLDLVERFDIPLRRRLDAVIRLGPDPAPAGALRLAPLRRVVCASPAYLHGAGPVERLPALATHALLDKRHDDTVISWRHVLGADVALPPRRLRCDDLETLRLAALDGLGVACLPTWLVGEDLRRHRLRALFHEAALPSGPQQWLWLVPSQTPLPARVARLAQVLRQAIGQPPHWDRPG
ncbi:DNA-binding transcriptional LysR family regulator [Xanthomonas sacchari]|uniref:LysR family transcriptional regulator n=1 Tax=Xanthomonas sacchari TaxID=56458 RepID=UPI0027826A30|nr:LysR family transcriptional regulator [Xanthomonas sacchari]MDQ1091401.1 DNA-binding transcriptional LysR family regulator [Xanthomonas sacchari]